MALDAGDASPGMAKAIYDAMDAAVNDPTPREQPPDVQGGSQKLPVAIASGIVSHIVASTEIAGVQSSGAPDDDGNTIGAT